MSLDDVGDICSRDSSLGGQAPEKLQVDSLPSRTCCLSKMALSGLRV